MSTVRKCFPRASDAIVQKWIEKAYLAYGRKQRGSNTLFVFNVYELVHIGVVLEASKFQILKTGFPIFITDICTNAPSIRPTLRLMYFGNPVWLTEVYESSGFDCVYMFYGDEAAIEGSTGRNRRAIETFRCVLRIPVTVSSDFMGDFAIPHGDEKQFLRHSSVLLIHVGYIADKVGRALGLGQLWKSRIDKK